MKHCLGQTKERSRCFSFETVFESFDLLNEMEQVISLL